MFDVDEIMEKIRKKEMDRKIDRCDIVRTYRTDKEILKYLSKKLKNFGIEIRDELEGRAIDLQQHRHLEGYCWQTTESCIVFLNDEDYIERGILKLDEGEEDYYHSWICFKYRCEEYVFDPCLNLLCQKGIYHQILEAKIKGMSLEEMFTMP